MQSRATTSGWLSPVSVRRVVCLALAAAAVPAAVASAATAARPAKGGYYAWKRGDNFVDFTVSRRGTTLKYPTIDLATRCTNGREGIASLFDDPPSWRLPISRAGSFAGTYRVGDQWLEPFVASEEYSLSGSFTRRGRAARLLLRARQVGEGGTVCDSGDRRGTARRDPPLTP
jgi:hypothetical protein